MCRHYVHCINEWVSAAPSNIRVECLDGQTGGVRAQAGAVGDQEQELKEQELKDRNDKLEQQKVLEIDPRALP